MKFPMGAYSPASTASGGITTATLIPSAPTKADIISMTQFPMVYQFMGTAQLKECNWLGWDQVSIMDDIAGYPDQATADLAWIGNHAQVVADITDNTIDFTNTTSGGGRIIGYLLRETVSDLNWVLTFKIRFTTLTPTTNTRFSIILTDSTAQSTTAQDAIGITFYNSSTKTDFVTIASNGETIVAGETDASATLAWAVDTDYFVRVIRISATSFSVAVYSDAAMTVEVVAKVTSTVSSGVVGLKYIYWKNAFLASSQGQTGYFTDIVFANGISEVS